MPKGLQGRDDLQDLAHLVPCPEPHRIPGRKCSLDISLLPPVREQEGHRESSLAWREEGNCCCGLASWELQGLWLPEKEKTLSITQRLPGWELLQEHVSLASELSHTREAVCARVCVCSCTRCVHVSAYTCTGMCSCRCIHGRKRTF